MSGDIEAVLETSGVAYVRRLHGEMPFPIRSPQDCARAWSAEEVWDLMGPYVAEGQRG